MRLMDRVQGALLGLAIGEGLGQRINQDPDGPIVLEGQIAWGGGTQGALYAAHAVLATPPDADLDRWGTAFARQLAARWHDPTMAERTRSASSVHAMDRSAHGHPWWALGAPGRDGAEPVLRAVPIGCVFLPGSLDIPTRIGTEVTTGPTTRSRRPS